MSGIVRQPSYINYLVPVFLPIFIGFVGKLWVNTTQEPASWAIVLFAAVSFALGSAFTWKLSTHKLHFEWTPAFYKALSVVYMLAGAALIVGRLWWSSKF